jgi:hypothetical protein
MNFALPQELYDLAERRATKIVTDWARRLHVQYGIRLPQEEAHVLVHDLINFFAVMRVSDRIWRLSPDRSKDESA